MQNKNYYFKAGLVYLKFIQIIEKTELVNKLFRRLSLLVFALLIPFIGSSQLSNVQIISDPLLDGEAYGIVEAENDVFYLFNDNNELFEIKTDTVRQLNFDSRFSELEDLYYEGVDSLLFMASQEGLYRYVGDEAILLAGFRGYYDVNKSSDGTIYISSQSSSNIDNKGFGVSTDDGNSFNYFTEDNSALPTNIIYDIEVDTDDNVWLATHAGLVKYDGSIFTVLTNDGLSETFYDVDIAPDGSVWASSGFGGLGKVEDGTLKNFPQYFNSFSKANQVSVDSKGGAWTEDSEFIRVTDTDTIKIAFSEVGLGSGFIARELFVDSKDRLWVTLNGSNDLAILTFDFISTVSSLSAEKIKVYPNPVTNYLQIDFTEQIGYFENYQIGLSDLNGRQILLESITSEHPVIDVNTFPKGIYFLSLFNEGIQEAVQKIVIK